MRDDDKYKLCERCQLEFVLGGGLCTDCAAAQLEEEQYLDAEASLLDACNEILDSIYPDGTLHSMVTPEYVYKMLRDLAAALAYLHTGDDR